MVPTTGTLRASEVTDPPALSAKSSDWQNVPCCGNHLPMKCPSENSSYQPPACLLGSWVYLLGRPRLSQLRNHLQELPSGAENTKQRFLIFYLDRIVQS